MVRKGRELAPFFSRYCDRAIIFYCSATATSATFFSLCHWRGARWPSKWHKCPALVFPPFLLETIYKAFLKKIMPTSQKISSAKIFSKMLQFFLNILVHLSHHYRRLCVSSWNQTHVPCYVQFNLLTIFLNLFSFVYK